MPATAAFSVLMPVHDAADPAQLRAALASVLDQDRPAAEVVVVADGPLGVEASRVVAQFVEAYAATGGTARLLPLERHVGIAAALQAGLEATTQPWVARADADDLNDPGRFAAQERVLATGRVDVLGTAMAEFDDDPATPHGLRVLPPTHEAIARGMRTTNQVNHPSVVFSRDAALRAGGYRPVRGMEDYDLWARMLADGARFANLTEPLVSFRASPAMQARRGGLAFLRAEVQMQRNLMFYGLVGRPTAARNLLVRSAYRLLPTRLREQAYRRLFRSGTSRGQVT